LFPFRTGLTNKANHWLMLTRNDVSDSLDADNLEVVVFWAQGNCAGDGFGLYEAAFFSDLLLVFFDWA
jgi:hypothetical protein